MLCLTARGWAIVRILAVCLVVQTVAGADRPGPFAPWLSSVESLPPSARSSAIEARIREAGGTPLRQGRDLLFLVRSSEDEPPRIVGDFNAWGWNPEGFDTTAGTMRRIDGTEWYWLHVQLLPGARVEYQVARGMDRFSTDPLNCRVVESFEGRSSEVVLADYVEPPELAAPDAGTPRGRVETHRLVSQVLGNTRNVHVYLPAGYSPMSAPMPVAYFGDGTIFLERGLVPRILDRAIADGRLPPMLAVLVDPVDRRDEYGMSAEYRQFMADELIPFVSGRYRASTDRRDRVAVGGSRGGMMALDLALARDDLFGAAVAFAPATLPKDLVGEFRRLPRKDLQLFIVAGLYDRRWLPDARALRDACRE